MEKDELMKLLEDMGRCEWNSDYQPLEDKIVAGFAKLRAELAAVVKERDELKDKNEILINECRRVKVQRNEIEQKLIAALRRESDLRFKKYLEQLKQSKP